MSQHVRDPGIRTRMPQETAAVDRHESFERVGRCGNPRRRKRPRDERRRAVADHPPDAFFSEWSGAALLEQRVRCLGDIAPRVDEGAVQIEHDETVGTVHDGLCLLRALSVQSLARNSANEVGVSQTVTRTTEKPWSAALSKISFAMRSTVGLLSSRNTGSPSA